MVLPGPFAACTVETGLSVFDIAQTREEDAAFFNFGRDVVCYGRVPGEIRPDVDGALRDASRRVVSDDGSILLPFDPDEVLDNLRYERYIGPTDRKTWMEGAWVHRIYYGLRPLLPVGVRRHLQRMYTRSQSRAEFPRWPLDRSADLLAERLLVLAMERLGTDRLPFVWFWPEGHSAAAILTHDIETRAGRDFTERLMDLDEAIGFRSAFQIVPEERYEVPPDFIQGLRERGFEVNLHGLDHDGNLFANRTTFLEKANRINEYAKRWGARGFRSCSLYRNVDWFGELDFAYDMSIPNVARYEAQPGGCCTVMPYFLPAGTLELPLTLAEDYTLFHILDDYSTKVWEQQSQAILDRHGLISLLVHPDYVAERRAQAVYRSFLDDLARLESDRGVWMALPGEVDAWWRQREGMTLVSSGSGWKVSGPGSERARVAHACLDAGRIVYEVSVNTAG